MKFLDLTFPEPVENLACDEMLLDRCRESGEEILRVWEPTTPFVVLGRSNSFRREANVELCARHRVPILRRCSGGGTVLQAPGCLNYALILRVSTRPELKTVPSTNRYVMEQHRALLEKLLGAKVEIHGHTDLALTPLHAERVLKVSGNAQRRGRDSLLFHGTFLLSLDLQLVEAFLPMPSIEPAYRQGRSHREFLANLGVPRPSLVAALRREWDANESLEEPDWSKVQTLAKTKYDAPEWNRRV